MIKRLRVPAILLAAIAAVALTAPTAEAGGFGWGSHIWSSPYPADLSDLYRVGRIPTPPYFALHPPVYYDVPVPRTYGHGPWAYPPYVTTPEITESKPEPEIIKNQYVPQSLKKEPPKSKVASAPVLIRNPYVVDAEDESEAALAAK